MLGGIAPCGREICCAAFMGDFDPVSIKMAKEQNLSLNPSKISGLCGRLMCCLRFENDVYDEAKDKFPKNGQEVSTEKGIGTVVDKDIIKGTVKIDYGEDAEQIDVKLEEIEVL
jgi:cell fate regulator YaaT (PSP1 superfamily)